MVQFFVQTFCLRIKFCKGKKIMAKAHGGLLDIGGGNSRIDGAENARSPITSMSCVIVQASSKTPPRPCLSSVPKPFTLFHTSPSPISLSLPSSSSLYAHREWPSSYGVPLHSRRPCGKQQRLLKPPSVSSTSRHSDRLHRSNRKHNLSSPVIEMHFS